LLLSFLRQVPFFNLVVRDAVADVLVGRHEEIISVHVLRRDGQLEVIVLP
jgi:hypothetical protein